MQNIYYPEFEVEGYRSGYCIYSSVRSMARRRESIFQSVDLVELVLPNGNRELWDNGGVNECEKAKIHISYKRCRKSDKVSILSKYTSNFLVIKEELFELFQTANLSPHVHLEKCSVNLVDACNFYALFLNEKPFFYSGFPDEIHYKGDNTNMDYDIDYTKKSYIENKYDIEINQLNNIMFSESLAKNMLQIDDQLHFDCVIKHEGNY